MSDHEWYRAPFMRWDSCKACGMVKRLDGKNQPCRGPLSLVLRGDPPSDRDKLADAMWKTIAADDNLKRARSKLSMHELGLIIGHALDCAACDKGGGPALPEPINMWLPCDGSERKS